MIEEPLPPLPPTDPHTAAARSIRYEPEWDGRSFVDKSGSAIADAWLHYGMVDRYSKCDESYDGVHHVGVQQVNERDFCTRCHRSLTNY